MNQEFIGLSYKVNVGEVLPEFHSETYGMELLGGCRLLNRVIDSHFIVNKRINIVIAKKSIWTECVGSKTFRRRKEFNKALRELEEANLIRIIILDGVVVIVPTEKLITRYDGNRVITLFSIK